MSMNVVVNSLWIGDALGRMEQLSIFSHLQQDHQYHLWAYRPLKPPNGVILEDANEILPESEIFTYHIGEESGSVSAFSNLFRYKLLLTHGGWWCDSDVICLKPFDFQEPYVFASERYPTGASGPTTCVIYATKDSQVMEYCWNKASQIDRRLLRWGTIGPALLMDAVFYFRLEQYVRPVNDFCPVHWFDINVLFQPGELPNAYAVHLWNEMWRRKHIDKEAEFPDSLYATLRSVYEATG